MKELFLDNLSPLVSSCFLISCGTSPFVRLLGSKLFVTSPSPQRVASWALEQKLLRLVLRPKKTSKSATKIRRSKGKRKPQNTMKSKRWLKKRRTRKMWTETETLARRLARRELTNVGQWKTICAGWLTF